MPELPTGTVTFLFTDIEGSTARWEHERATMHAVLARHDAILHQAIETHGGQVFKTVGDAFCAVFAAAPDALRATLAAQRSLQVEAWPEVTGPLRVRMALHTGAVEQRGGDYFGPPLNRVARLLAAGHGGQILLSAVVQELVRDQLPPSAELRSLGEHRLRDLIRPEHIFQLLAPDLARDFPPLHTLENRPNNLPLQPTPFLGRERELAALGKLLRTPTTRLITVTGPGGTGKTRLALQAAADALDDFADGAWFVNLATIDDPALVVPTIARVLGVHETGKQPLVDLLTHHLQDKTLLLLLDNFEQVTAAAPAIADLLAVAPRLTVLVTSRAPLRLRGEHEYPVPPFAVPDPRRLPALATLSQYDAVRLFVERAQEVRPDFAVTNENAPAVAEICVRLDGLPLAIELAAARVRLFPPQALLARLRPEGTRRLKLLTGGARDLPARQQTLRGAIDWSYSLLQPDEQTLFARLAVFLGGRTFEAIEAVCNPEGALDVLAGVESLVEKSLLRQEEGPGGEPRLVMLETIHEYAAERLEASGDAQALRRRHAEYFVHLAETAEWRSRGPDQPLWLERLAAEHDNFRAALRWCVDRGEVALGLRLAGHLGYFWWTHGDADEGRQWLQKFLSRDSGSQTAARADALTSAGNLAHLQGDSSAAISLLDESLALNRTLGRPGSTAEALRSLGAVALAAGDYRTARMYVEEGLAVFRTLGRADEIAHSLRLLGTLAHNLNDDQEARSLLTESLALYREQGNRWGAAYALNSLGEQARARGDIQEAAERYAESLALFREVRDVLGISMVLSNQGYLALQQGNLPRAAALLRESLQPRYERKDRGGAVAFLPGLAAVAAARGRTREAVRLFGAVEALLEHLGTSLERNERADYDRYVAAVRTQLDQAAFATAWAQGRAMTLEQAVALALEETA